MAWMCENKIRPRQCDIELSAATQELHVVGYEHPMVRLAVKNEGAFVEKANATYAQNMREVHFAKVQITIGEAMLRLGKKKAIMWAVELDHVIEFISTAQSDDVYEIIKQLRKDSKLH